MDGKVLDPFRGERRCCHASDFDGQEPCPASVLAECSEGCGTPDERYPSLLDTGAVTGVIEARKVVRAYCAEGSNRRPGDRCAVDDDCRPAAEGVVALSCDASSGKCIEVPRPAAPAALFGDCGLRGTVVAPTLRVLAAPECESCLAVAPPNGCVQQGCTMACEFDEDCPTGGICACTSATGACYCVPDTEDRADASPDWLKCY